LALDNLAQDRTTHEGEIARLREELGLAAARHAAAGVITNPKVGELEALLQHSVEEHAAELQAARDSVAKVATSCVVHAPHLSKFCFWWTLPGRPKRKPRRAHSSFCTSRFACCFWDHIVFIH
jgi:hypothetical protein